MFRVARAPDQVWSDVMVDNAALLAAVRMRDINYVVRCLQAGDSAAELSAAVEAIAGSAFSVDPQREAKIKRQWLKAIAENVAVN
jgi:VIT1/CCC1 family predicted Fe2+/Mn2+ transporter